MSQRRSLSVQSRPMTLWSIQVEEAFALLEREGRLRVPWSYGEPDYAGPYRWMVQQMTRRIGPPPAKGLTPIWAWYQYKSEARPKPDLRRTQHLPSGTIGYRLELVVDLSRCLLSDFILWHCVLNNYYLPISEADSERFDALHGSLPTVYLDSATRASWDRIFDLEWDDPYIADPKPTKMIQATLWEINRSDVVAVDRFVAR